MKPSSGCEHGDSVRARERNVSANAKMTREDARRFRMNHDGERGPGVQASPPRPLGSSARSACQQTTAVYER